MLAMSMLNLIGEGFTGFVGYFNKKGRGVVNKYISVSGKNDPEWGNSSVVLDYYLEDGLQKNNYVSPGDAASAYLLFRFKRSSVILRAYTLRTRTFREDEAHAKSWIVEGSIDGNHFEIIDTVNNTELLQGNGNYSTFSCDKEIVSKYIRITLTEKTYYSLYRLHLTRVDFFGEMLRYCQYTMKYKSKPNWLYFMILLL